MSIISVSIKNRFHKAFLFSAFFCIAEAKTFAAAKTALSAQDICKRLEIAEEVLVFDATTGLPIDVIKNSRKSRGGGFNSGDKDSKDDTVCKSSSSSGNTSSSFDGSLYFFHEWIVKKDGSIAVEYEQGTGFQGQSRDAKMLNSTGRQTVKLKDLSPISWVSTLHKNQRIVVRLTPSLIEGEKIRELNEFPIVLDDATIYDGKSRLWTTNLSADGDFVGITTMQGALVLSFQPFAGGEKIGRALGREITFKLEDGTSVVIKSESPIVPGNISADVYVLVDLNLRAKRIGSQHVSTGSKADDVIKRLRR